MKLKHYQVQSVKQHFILFAVRDLGFTHRQATDEFERLMATPLIPFIQDVYVKRPRIGADFVLSRREKVRVFMTFENAINHGIYAMP